MQFFTKLHNPVVLGKKDKKISYIQYPKLQYPAGIDCLKQHFEGTFKRIRMTVQQ
jgi:hypothetical protein